jgi:predicted kinase
MKAIICDIDGTLADCRHRLHYVLPGAKRDCDAFFAGMANDVCIDPVADLIRAAHARYEVVLCSGRPEKYRPITMKWLYDNDVAFDALYMRPDDDTRPDHIVKMQILRGIREDGYEPFIVIDDRQSVVDMWRDAGLVCLQAAPAQEPIPHSAVLTLMVGPSGAGKTTWLQSDAALDMGIKPWHIVSSDAVREDLCGDFRCQDRNIEVFAAVHAIARTRLKAGLPTVIDATHIRRKDRMTSAALAGDAQVRYVVVDRPLSLKKLSAGWRADVMMKGGSLIDVHAQTFAAQLKDILACDGLPNVTVHDFRHMEEARSAA